MADGQVDQAVERRVIEFAALLQFAFDKALKITLVYFLQHRMRRIEGLDQHPAAFMFAARPAGDLGKQLVSPLAGPEIGKTDQLIGAEHADNTDIIEIQA